MLTPKVRVIYGTTVERVARIKVTGVSVVVIRETRGPLLLTWADAKPSSSIQEARCGGRAWSGVVGGENGALSFEVIVFFPHIHGGRTDTRPL